MDRLDRTHEWMHGRQRRCRSCGKPIDGRYWNVIGTPGEFCDVCIKTHKRCDVCGGPLHKLRPEGQAAGEKEIRMNRKLQDGRYLCDHCADTAVFHLSRAETLLKQVTDHLKNRYRLRVRHISKLNLVGSDTMEMLMGAAKEKKGIPLGVFAQRGDSFEIYLLYGLPAALLTVVIAHEFAHAWQVENAPNQGDPMLIEGFAEWLAFKVATAYGYEHELDRIRAQQGLYGDGFRYFRKIEKQKGEAGAFQFYKEHLGLS